MAPSQPDAEHADAADLKRKTFYLSDGLSARLTALAERERVGQSELVRYLLDFALREIEEGRHQLPAEPVDRRTLNA